MFEPTNLQTDGNYYSCSCFRWVEPEKLVFFLINVPPLLVEGKEDMLFELQI